MILEVSLLGEYVAADLANVSLYVGVVGLSVPDGRRGAPESLVAYFTNVGFLIGVGELVPFDVLLPEEASVAVLTVEPKVLGVVPLVNRQRSSLPEISVTNFTHVRPLVGVRSLMFIPRDSRFQFSLTE